MPLFEYICKRCGEEFEELVLNAGEKVKCPKCSSTRVEKKMSIFAHKSGEKFSSTTSSSCSTCSATSCATCGVKK